jgi:hypothetical protein
MRMLQRRLDAVSLIIALTALFLALGGSATASEQPAAPGVSTVPLAYTTLTLQNGWTGGPFSTRIPAVAKDSFGIVHFKGAMATSGTNPTAFTLPLAFRPSGTVYVTVDLCNANKGRLVISTNGVVFVEAENGTFSNAQCFTSLDGVGFSK